MNTSHRFANYSTLRVPDIAVVIPTFEEETNVQPISTRIAEVLKESEYEIIFVDDHSRDGTADTVRRLSRTNPRLRIIERIGRRGLSTAVIEGLMSTSAPLAVVIDGDLQHDESIIPAMLQALKEGADLAVGSRYLSGAGTGDWSRRRRQMSLIATRVSLFTQATHTSDPMSGFFALRTEMFRSRAVQLAGSGYKILLDLLTTDGPPLKIREFAYVFRPRERGTSKLDARVTLEFGKLILAKTVGRFLPVRFVMFLMVGAIGVGVHFLALSALLLWQPFAIAQVGATLTAMTGNFLLNNWFTYFDLRLRRWRLLRGWFVFCAASSVGLIANTGVAVYLYTVAGAAWYAAALAGVMVSAIWNYLSTSLVTWKA